MTDAQMTRRSRRRAKTEVVVDPPSEDVQEAVRRLRALEDQAEEGRAAYAALVERTQELRREIGRAVGDLDEARRAMRRDRDVEARIEAKIGALKSELERKQARMEELGQRNAATRELADRCRAWLESGGASVESLEAGMPLPARPGGGRVTTAEGEAAATEAARSGLFGS